MSKTPPFETAIAQKLDTIIRILEDLFTLEAAKAKIKQAEIRKLVGVDIVRINRIAKHLKTRGDRNGKASPRS